MFKVNLEKEIHKCKSVEEAVNYLKAYEKHGSLSLRKYRKCPQLQPLPKGLSEIVNAAVPIYVGMAIIQVVLELEIDGKEVN